MTAHPRATKDLDALVRATTENASGVFEIDGSQSPVIGRAALLRNKRAAGRAQDIADAEALERRRP